jgi:hypothetical protein
LALVNDNEDFDAAAMRIRERGGNVGLGQVVDGDVEGFLCSVDSGNDAVGDAVAVREIRSLKGG